MLTKNQKRELVKDLTEKLSKIKTAIFTDYTGLSVVKMTELRRQLKEQDAEMRVIKKTLVDLALKESKAADFQIKKLNGQLAVVFGYCDEVAPAKVLYNFSKKEEHLKILGGLLENSFVNSEQVISLAKLPSRPELLGRTVGAIAAPLSGFINVLQGNLRNLVYVLANIKRL